MSTITDHIVTTATPISEIGMIYARVKLLASKDSSKPLPSWIESTEMYFSEPMWLIYYLMFHCSSCPRILLEPCHIEDFWCSTNKEAIAEAFDIWAAQTKKKLLQMSQDMTTEGNALTYGVAKQKAKLEHLFNTLLNY